MRTILSPKSGRTVLPDRYLFGHELCFLTHDILAELIVSAEQQGVFSERFTFRDNADSLAFENADDVFAWFDATGRKEERAGFLRRTVFPALMSDFLHFVYEALESSRKAKLNITYALLRKPLQENLFLLELIASDLHSFATHLTENPLLLRSQKAGGLDVHNRRIASVLTTLGEAERFDAGYLAQLRYDKNADDGFDGICNKAVHLFTEHHAIRTEKLNINFIFSDWDAKLTQWGYLYSRLPYLLAYAHCLAEHVFGTFERSDPVYFADIKRRLHAATILWADTLEDKYRHPGLVNFAESVRVQLESECRANKWPTPTKSHLLRMRADGAWPGESGVAVRLRHLRFSALAYMGKVTRR